MSSYYLLSIIKINLHLSLFIFIELYTFIHFHVHLNLLLTTGALMITLSCITQYCYAQVMQRCAQKITKLEPPHLTELIAYEAECTSKEHGIRCKFTFPFLEERELRDVIFRGNVTRRKVTSVAHTLW